MLKHQKIHIKKIYEDAEIGNSRLEFNINGADINYVVINTLRRIIFTNIPTYAFTDFKFEKNTSVFHNNYLKQRLKYLPVWGIENNLDVISISNNRNANTVVEEDYNDEELDEITKPVEYNTPTLKQLTMYVKYKNKTNDIVSVTTDNAKFYYDEKQIKSPYKSEIPIVKLKSDQEISFSVISSIGIEEDDTIYSAVSIVTYKEIDENNFNFILESKGQINEKRILFVAIFNINTILNTLNLLVQSLQFEKIELTEGSIKLIDYDNTMGNLITRGLQQHKDIKFAGYSIPHPLEKVVLLQYKTTTNILNNIDDVIKYYIELFNNIKKLIEKNI